MASASSWGRLHMGQWPVGRSIAVKLVRCATELNIGLPAAASSRTWTLGIEQQINVVSTSWRALLDSATRARATCAGSGTARARNRSRCSLLRPSKLACLPRVSKSGSGSSAVSSGRSGAKAPPLLMGPESTQTIRWTNSGCLSTTRLTGPFAPLCPTRTASPPISSRMAEMASAWSSSVRVVRWVSSGSRPGSVSPTARLPAVFNNSTTSSQAQAPSP